MPTNVPSGLDITSARLRLGLSQAEFAALVGASQASVSRWEAAFRTPTGLYAAAVIRAVASTREEQ